MIIIPSRAVDRDKLFAEKVRNSHHMIECLDCGQTMNLCTDLNGDSDVDIHIQSMIADHVGKNQGHIMLESDDLQ